MARTAPRRLSKWARRLALLLVTLVLCEAGFRIWLRVAGTPYRGAAVEARLCERLRDLQVPTFLEPPLEPHLEPPLQDGAHRSPRRLLDPYIGWRTGRAQAELEDRARVTRSRDPDTFLVWVVGGSVAAQFANRNSGLEPLIEHLERSPILSGRRILVHNYALAAFKEPQQLMLVAYLFSLGLVPDAVINIDGFNEVAIGSMNSANGADPIYPSVVQWASLALPPGHYPVLEEVGEELLSVVGRARRFGRALVGLGLHRSALLGTLGDRALGRWAWKRDRIEVAYMEALLTVGPCDTLRGAARGDEREPLDAIVTSWVEASRSLHAICAARGVRYLHVLQPTLHDEGSKPLTPEELASSGVRDSWREGARDGYPRLRAAAEELRAAGVAFEDASDVFREVGETLYFDSCHFGRAGNELLAARVAEALLAALADG